MAKPQHDWTEIVAKARRMLETGEVQPTFWSVAQKLKLSHSTFLQGMKRLGYTQEDLNNWHKTSNPSTELVDLYDYIKSAPRSLTDIANRMGMTPAAAQDLITRARDAGYLIGEHASQIVGSNSTQLQIGTPAPTLADEVGGSVLFAVAGDIHAGSKASQPSALQSFLRTARNEGVKHVLVPGDVFHGVYGYRGMMDEVVPGAWPIERSRVPAAAEAQIQLAEAYINPREYSDMQFYVIGGNHDAWFVREGVDPIQRLCARHDNMHFLGHHIADVPLTSTVSARMWHPTGGIPYARSYRAQKGVEALMQEVLHKADFIDSMPAAIRFLFVGHLHIEAKVQLGSVIAVQTGCFEGRTNYLAQKGLYPMVGGSIWRAHLTDTGKVHRTDYSFLSYLEIEDDWKNFPLPAVEETDIAKVDVLFTSLE